MEAWWLASSVPAARVWVGLEQARERMGIGSVLPCIWLVICLDGRKKVGERETYLVFAWRV